MEKQKEKKIYVDYDDINSIIKNLTDFDSNLRSMKKLNNILSTENLEFFNSLLPKENVKINLLLCKIFISIISSEYLFKIYIPSIKEDENAKIDLILELINNISSLTAKMNNFILSFELFDLKRKTLGLLNYLYNNIHNKLNEGNESLNKIIELMNNLPSKFFSEAFNEMSSNREIFEIIKSQNIYNITRFEDKFSEINNCFEQNEIFKKFIELNSDLKLSKSLLEEEELEIKRFDNSDDDLIKFYEKYGTLLMKFCAYHYYIFLDKKEQIKEENNENQIEGNEDEEENENEPTKVLFLINKISKEKNCDEIKEEAQKNRRVESLLKNKKFKSVLGSKEYQLLIKSGIQYYLQQITKFENNPKLKVIKSHLIYFSESLGTKSYFPLFLKNLDKMVINDNFIQSYMTNVSAGAINRYYFETNFEEDTLIYFEFFLEDKSKDINFELNQYDNNSNSFKTIYKQERADQIVRIFMYCLGYSIYEIVFDNYYSWFNSKDVNFRISFLLPIKDETSEEIPETEEYFVVNKEKYYYINKENPKQNQIDIPIILNMNNLKIVNIKNNDNEEKNYDLEFKENKEEDEEIISKVYFNYILFNYLKKKKYDINQQIVISIFSQNNNLLDINEEIKEKIKECENDEAKKKFIKSIGFYPDNKIGDYNINYKLYDIDDQLVINHKLLKYKKNKEEEDKKIQEDEKNEIKDKEENELNEQNKVKNNEIKNDKENNKEEKKEKNIYKSILLIHIYKNLVKTILFHKGKFFSKFKILDSKEINFCDIDINKEEEIFNAIKSIYDKINDLEIIMACNNKIKEENKKGFDDLIEKIKKYCQEKLNPPINDFEYDINEICNDIIKYNFER